MNNITSDKQKIWVLIGISIASFVGCIDFTIVNTALPAIQREFHSSIGELQWIINIFILALSAFMVIAGRIADVYGRRTILYIGMVVFGLSSLFAGLATNMLFLILCRLLQGISCTILYTATGAIVSNTFPVTQRGKAMGILFGVNALGLAVGPVLGGFIIGALSWRWVFFVNIPLVILSLAICIPNVAESKNSHDNNKIDIAGAVILVFALSSLVLAFTQANTYGWTSIITLGLFSFALLMLIAFYIVEGKLAEPIIKFDLFTNRKFITSIVATFSMAFFYCVAFFLMPLYLHDIRGDNDYLIGIMLLPVTGTIAVISPIIGRYVDRRGPRNPLLIGFVFFALSAILQANFSMSDSLLHVILAFICMGVGWACILGPSTVLALSSLPESSGALAMGASWTLHNIGGVIGLGVGLAVFYARSSKTHSFIMGYRSSMWLLAAVSILALLVVYRNFAKNSGTIKEL